MDTEKILNRLAALTLLGAGAIVVVVLVKTTLIQLGAV